MHQCAVIYRSRWSGRRCFHEDHITVAHLRVSDRLCVTGLQLILVVALTIDGEVVTVQLECIVDRFVEFTQRSCWQHLDALGTFRTLNTQQLFGKSNEKALVSMRLSDCLASGIMNPLLEINPKSMATKGVKQIWWPIKEVAESQYRH